MGPRRLKLLGPPHRRPFLRCRILPSGPHPVWNCFTRYLPSTALIRSAHQTSHTRDSNPLDSQPC
ncbi:hypothetical protein HMPREF9069_01177 [Atopobium sp. oral taxon 810 str. F0209]|nr:hypothetical protein HMPREF9069_01177 [Atopobium sp. oral taxon 810 str. F0209]